MDPIKREELKLFGVSPAEAGYYYESLIINKTPSPIMIIDHNNHKMIVEPTDGKIDGTIVIYARSNNGPRKTFSKKDQCKVDVALAATKITIDSWAVESGSIYIKELDAIITNPEFGDSIRHHNSNITSRDEIIEAIQGLVNNKDGVFIHFIANDPKSRTTEIFGAFGTSNMFKIHVLDIQNGTEKNATITVVIGSKSRTNVQQIIDIESLFEHGSMCMDGQTIPLSLGLTADDAMRAAGMKAKETERIIFDQLAKRMAEEREENKQKINELKDIQKSAVEEINRNHLIKETELKKSLADVEIQLKAMTEWRSLYLARSDVAKSDCDVHTYQAKRLEAEERTQKAKLATNAEWTKFMHTLFKIAGGVVVGVAVPWIASKIKKE